MDILLKIPLLLLGMYCVHKAAKPPNPPAAPEEQAKYHAHQKAWDRFILWLSLKEPALFRYTTYCITLCEVLAITFAAATTDPALPALFRPSTSFPAHKLAPSPAFYAGTLCMCTGALIRAACYAHLGRFFTFDLALKRGHALVTSGPYAVVRHPSYVGACVFYLGCVLSLLGPGSWLAEGGLWDTRVGWVCAGVYVGRTVAICVWLIKRVPREDRVLRQAFEEQWVAWTQRTPYRLVPFVY